MEEQKRERHTRRHPVRAFFRGMYTEVAFSGESLRINGRGLLFGLVVGLLVGVWGGLFARLLGAANHLREGTGWAMFLLPLAGLLVVWMYRRGGIKTAGGTDLIIQAARGEQPVSRLLAPVIFAATLLTHGFGGSAGREGAALQLGGSLAELVRTGGKLGAEFQDLAIMCGMSAGFSAVFGSQITAALFALEISCVGILPLGGLFPCVVSSLAAGTVARAMGVRAMRFYLSASTPDVLFYGQVLVLGIACGLLSILVCYTFSGVRAGLARLFPNPYLRVVVGSAGVMVLTLILGTKTYLGTGEAAAMMKGYDREEALAFILSRINRNAHPELRDQIDGLIAQAIDQGRAAPQDCFLKLLLTALTLGAGLKGGEIVPCFAIGASFGCVVGPLLGLPAPYAAAVGMVALFCGVTNCPLTALMLGFEVFFFCNPGGFLMAVAASFLVSGYSGLYAKQKFAFSKTASPEGLAHEARRERTGPL